MESTSGTLMSLFILESIITAAGVLMFVYRGMLDMKEDDRIVLDDAEAHLEREQLTVRQRATAIGKYIKVVGVAWSVLAVVILGLWVVEGLKLV